MELDDGWASNWFVNDKFYESGSGTKETELDLAELGVGVKLTGGRQGTVYEEHSQEELSVFGSTTTQDFGVPPYCPLNDAGICGFGKTSSCFGQTGSAFDGSMFSNTSGLLCNSNLLGQTSLFRSMQPAQSSGSLGYNNNIDQSQAAPTNSFFGQSTFGQMTATQNNVVTQAAPLTNSFGTLPAIPRVSIGRPGTSPSIQYGISSLPVSCFNDDAEIEALMPKLQHSDHYTKPRIEKIGATERVKRAPSKLKLTPKEQRGTAMVGVKFDDCVMFVIESKGTSEITQEVNYREKLIILQDGLYLLFAGHLSTIAVVEARYRTLFWELSEDEVVLINFLRGILNHEGFDRKNEIIIAGKTGNGEFVLTTLVKVPGSPAVVVRDNNYVKQGSGSRFMRETLPFLRDNFMRELCFA